MQGHGNRESCWWCSTPHSPSLPPWSCLGTVATAQRQTLPAGCTPSTKLMTIKFCRFQCSECKTSCLKAQEGCCCVSAKATLQDAKRGAFDSSRISQTEEGSQVDLQGFAGGGVLSLFAMHNFQQWQHQEPGGKGPNRVNVPTCSWIG